MQVICARLVPAPGVGQGDGQLVEQSHQAVEHEVHCTDHHTGKDHKHNDNAGVVDDLFLTGPDDLFHFATQITEETSNVRGSPLEKTWFLAFLCHKQSAFRLLGFFVKSVFSAELAIFVHFKSVRVILLVFLSVVVALFALCAS